MIAGSLILVTVCVLSLIMTPWKPSYSMLRKVVYCILLSSLTTFMLVAAGFNSFQIPLFNQDRDKITMWGRVGIEIVIFTNWFAIYMVSLIVTCTYH